MVTNIAVLLLLISAFIIWGGLALSGLFLFTKPEVDKYPHDELGESSIENHVKSDQN
jgi:hypothetical protein